MTATRTPGEQLFEEYLKTHDYAFDHEPGRPGATRRPDYAVRRDGVRILCEVKDFELRTSPTNKVGVYDPYPRIRKRIEEARVKFREYKDQTCCLVLHNQGDPFVDLESKEIALGAMYGDAGVTFSVDMKTGAAVAKPEFAFLKRGKMIQPHWKEPHNTTISALVAVRMVAIGGKRLSAYLKDHPEIKGEAILALSNEKVGFDIDEKRLGVISYENAFAARPLPREMFNGPYDIRWGVVAGGQAIVHKGEKLPDVPS